MFCSLVEPLLFPQWKNTKMWRMASQLAYCWKLREKNQIKLYAASAAGTNVRKSFVYPAVLQWLHLDLWGGTTPKLKLHRVCIQLFKQNSRKSRKTFKKNGGKKGKVMSNYHQTSGHSNDLRSTDLLKAFKPLRWMWGLPVRQSRVVFILNSIKPQKWQ